MAHAVVVVHAMAAELDRVDLLAERLPDHARAGEEHRRVLGHDDQVGQRRRVRAAAGGGAGHDRDLGDHAGQPDRVTEDPPVAGQRGRGPPACARHRTRRTPRPGSARALPSGAPGRSCRHGAPRASRRDTSRPRRSRRSAGRRRSRWRRGRRRRARRGLPTGCETHARAQRPNAPGVAQRLEPLERIEPPQRLAYQGRAHDGGPPKTRATLWPPNANELESAAGGRPFERTSGRASPGT